MPFPKTRKVKVVKIDPNGNILETVAEYEAVFVETDLSLRNEDQPLQLVMAPEAVVLVVLAVIP